MSDIEESASDAARRFARRLKLTEDMLYSAWAVIANAGWDGLEKSEGWQEAAVRWRDRWHDYTKTQGEDMPTLTAIHHLIRQGHSLYFEDMARNRHLLADCADSDVAGQIGQILAKYHGVELVNEPPKADSSTGTT